MSDQRGGVCLKTGKIGRVNILRQQLIAPGETVTSHVRGKVLLEATRERETLRVHGHLAAFLTPVRWLETNWTDYVREGPETSTTFSTASVYDMSALGIGAYNTSALIIPAFWQKAVYRVYNEWYKWPEDADITSWVTDGRPAVPLAQTWSRCRYTATPTNSEDYELASATSFDVRDLAVVQARFRSAIERDVLSWNRYMELMKEMFNADGSREVDQVPIMVDQATVGVSPRELPATDAAGLGDWQSVYDFAVDHRFGAISAPEHCVLTYVLVMRFAPIIESRNPHTAYGITWTDLVGDPEILRNSPPQEVQAQQVMTTGSATSLGYLPAGWQWRQGWDVVGQRIDAADSFPMMEQPTTQANTKDATRIKNAFRSAALGDYLVNLDFDERSRNLHGSALESYFSGMTGASSKSANPKMGKVM